MKFFHFFKFMVVVLGVFLWYEILSRGVDYPFVVISAIVGTILLAIAFLLDLVRIIRKGG